MKNWPAAAFKTQSPPRLPASLKALLLTQLAKTPSLQAARGVLGKWLQRIDAK